MQTRQIPRRPSLQDKGLRAWLDESAGEHNGVDYRIWCIMVGDDPDDPRASKFSLMRVMGYETTGPIYRLLAQMKRELA